jgi:DNA invertase Pin-like site-specific DNA recombinase
MGKKRDSNRDAYSYIRFSTGEQKSGRSEQRQIENFKRVCAEKGWTPMLKTYRDLGVSAFEGKNAKEGQLKAFMEAIERGKIKEGTVLVIESMDRLSRQDPWTTVSDLLMKITDMGVAIYSQTDDVFVEKGNCSTQDFIQLLMSMGRSHLESVRKKSFSSDIWKNKRANLTTKKATSACPAWLKLNKKRNEFDVIEEKAEIIQRIFELMASGYGQHSIERMFNEEKVKTIGRSKVWHKSYIQKLFSDRRLLGEYQPYTGKGSSRKKIGEPVTDYYPKVISEELYYQAKQARKNRKNQRGPNGKRVKNLLQGLCKDARDGHVMSLVDKGPRSSGPALVSSGAVRGEKTSTYISIPYEPIEEAILAVTSELDSSDLSPKKNDTTDVLARHKDALAKLHATEGRISEIQLQMLDENNPLDSILPVLGELENRAIKQKSILEDIRSEMYNEQSETIDDCKKIISILDDADEKDIYDIRMRLRSQLRFLIDEIWILPLKNKLERRAYIQVLYRPSGFRKFIVTTKGKEYEWIGHETIRPHELQNDLRTTEGMEFYSDLPWDKKII